jgi:hypothetical protein
VVFGFEPSGLFEKIILAPEIGTPRTPAPFAPREDESEFEGIDESGFEVSEPVFVGVAGVSFLGTFGTLTFGIVIVNWLIAGWVRNEVTAMAAIRISDDDLVMKYSPRNLMLGSQAETF